MVVVMVVVIVVITVIDKLIQNSATSRINAYLQSAHCVSGRRLLFPLFVPPSENAFPLPAALHLLYHRGLKRILSLRPFVGALAGHKLRDLLFVTEPVRWG